ALRTFSENHFIPAADLLPLRESSLALLPTLAPISQTEAEMKEPLRPAALDLFFSGSLPRDASDSHVVLTAGSSQPRHDVDNNAYALSLNAFLNLNALPSLLRNGLDVQSPGSDLQLVDAGGWSLIDYDALSQASANPESRQVTLPQRGE